MGKELPDEIVQPRINVRIIRIEGKTTSYVSASSLHRLRYQVDLEEREGRYYLKTPEGDETPLKGKMTRSKAEYRAEETLRMLIRKAASYR